MGDLLLANIHGARREGNKVTVSDYYSEGAPAIELELEEHTSLKDEAARYFARYTKAKRAKEEIATLLAPGDERFNWSEAGSSRAKSSLRRAALSLFFETDKDILQRRERQVEKLPESTLNLATLRMDTRFS